MDSLKLDRFRRLLNRQNTTNSVCDASSITTTPATSKTASLPITTTNTPTTHHNKNKTNKIGETSTKSNTYTTTSVDPKTTSSSIIAITVNIPQYITKDNPTPAVFIARKLFSDFIELASNRIEVILNSELGQCKDKPIFKSLQRGQDLIYDQVLEGLGAISEYCLPSLLTLLLAWYHYQLDIEDGSNSSSLNNSSSQQQQQKGPSSSLENSLKQQEVSLSYNENQDLNLPDCCGSPSCQVENNSLQFLQQNNGGQAQIRSPVPSSPDMLSTTTTNNLLSSSLPSDYQSPLISLTTTNQLLNTNTSDIQQQQQQQFNNNSAANTSNSTTTTNASGNNSITLDDSTNTIKRLELLKLRSLLIEYTFCQALIEIFSKLYLHPGHDDLIVQIEEIAFEHFKFYNYNSHHSSGSSHNYNQQQQQHLQQQQQQQQQQQHHHQYQQQQSQDYSGLNSNDINKLANKYAEVIGVLAKTRFNLVKRRFLNELNELRSNEQTTNNIQSIVTLLSGMKFFRVKMAPIEEFEASFLLLQELADYFVIVRHKSIRHALAELFVDIMLPLATIVKNEVKIPCLKNFVDTLWVPTLDMCTRKKHSSTLFPLVTCLLCLSQRPIFLQNWAPFLNMCQSSLKNRDQKMCKIALESLYRLIWMYMIRIKCESNNITQTRLNSIVDSLFPKGSRQIVPRYVKLSIFVDIILFIAQERLDFAMRHIIFELLSVDRPSSKVVIASERMSIGLQAFLVIADSLQQKESDPAMPLNIGNASIQISTNFYEANSSSGSNSNNSKTRRFNSSSSSASSMSGHYKMLNDEVAKSIGLHPYLNHIQKSFNEILKALDAQFGRPLMLTCYSNTNKDLDDIISADRRPKIDLFKICIAAIPRLIPDGMSKSELIDLLARMTIHVDEEMRRNAFESLQILVAEFQDWRLDAIEGYTLFLANQIDESLKYLVDSTLRMLLQLLITWRSLITPSSSSLSAGSNNNSTRTTFVNIQTGYETISTNRNSGGNGGAGGQIAARKNRALIEMRLIQSELSNTRFDRLVNVIQKVEGASLVMQCSCHYQTRKLASHLLRECRTILKCYSSWTCMEQFGFKSPDDVELSGGGGGGIAGDYGDDMSASLKGSLSADNLSRITATSANGLPAYNSATSMNTQAMLSTSVSKLCISSTLQQQQQQSSQHQHDLYDEDIENNLADHYSSDDNSTLIFWVAIMMLESDKEHEYVFALRLLGKILPNLPFEQQDFVDELERNLQQMNWQSTFPGLHALVLKGCPSTTTYELSISLLDHMTPILKNRICTANNRPEDCLPFHIIVLSTYLLSTYEDPSPFSLNIARRIALCCEENSQKLENLSAVMTLYSRRSFSKDAFQWIKCIAKYLNDACPKVVPNTIPLLVDLLESGPQYIQRLILPIIYCILTYIDISQQPTISFNADLFRIYNTCLGSSIARMQANNQQQQPSQWRDAMQIFKLIISKSSSLTSSTVVNSTSICTGGSSSSSSSTCAFASLTVPQSSIHLSSGFASLSTSVSMSSSGRTGLELPGRTMEFSIDVESLPVIAKSRLIEVGANLQAFQQQQQSVC